MFSWFYVLVTILIPPQRRHPSHPAITVRFCRTASAWYIRPSKVSAYADGAQLTTHPSPDTTALPPDPVSPSAPSPRSSSPPSPSPLHPAPEPPSLPPPRPSSP